MGREILFEETNKNIIAHFTKSVIECNWLTVRLRVDANKATPTIDQWRNFNTQGEPHETVRAVAE